MSKLNHLSSSVCLFATLLHVSGISRRRPSYVHPLFPPTLCSPRSSMEHGNTVFCPSITVMLAVETSNDGVEPTTDSSSASITIIR